MRNDTAGKGKPRRYPVRASEGRAQGAPVKGGSVGEARRAPCVSQKIADLDRCEGQSTLTIQIIRKRRCCYSY